MFTLRHDASNFFNVNVIHQSPITHITTGISEIKTFFIFNASHIPITSNLRYFMNDCFDTYTFNNIINLSRFKDILTWHNDKLINWNTTWSLLTSSIDCDTKSRTSYKQSSTHTFTLKLMANELPLLKTLQTIRNPNLYDSSWNCPSCNLSVEDWNHLWHCNTHKPFLSAILDNTKSFLLSKLDQTLITPSFIVRWNSLP
jgi:hypothetical protein